MTIKLKIKFMYAINCLRFMLLLRYGFFEYLAMIALAIMDI